MNFIEWLKNLFDKKSISEEEKVDKLIKEKIILILPRKNINLFLDLIL